MISRRQAMAMAITALVGAATPARAKDSSLVGQFDTDHDGTLTKEEYLAFVEQRFKAADKDHDGTLSNWEFQTPKGRALVRLLR